eukprot:2831331-Prymnesium_polylepis.2
MEVPGGRRNGAGAGAPCGGIRASIRARCLAVAPEVELEPPPKIRPPPERRRIAGGTCAHVPRTAGPTGCDERACASTPRDWTRGVASERGTRGVQKGGALSARRKARPGTARQWPPHAASLTFCAAVPAARRGARCPREMPRRHTLGPEAWRRASSGGCRQRSPGERAAAHKREDGKPTASLLVPPPVRAGQHVSERSGSGRLGVATGGVAGGGLGDQKQAQDAEGFHAMRTCPSRDMRAPTTTRHLPLGPLAVPGDILTAVGEIPWSLPNRGFGEKASHKAFGRVACRHDIMIAFQAASLAQLKRHLRQPRGNQRGVVYLLQYLGALCVLCGAARVRDARGVSTYAPAFHDLRKGRDPSTFPRLAVPWVLINCEGRGMEHLISRRMRKPNVFFGAETY